ncbi:MAG: TlpA family protein disulfide reductase [Planctomycetaceae bacterium]|jgi:thiol-disulfide isomerase/thioredoxin
MNRNQNWVLAALLGLGLASGTGRAFAWQETGDKGGETETADAIADRLKAISELFPSQPNARMTPEKLDQAQEQLQALIDDKVPAPRLLVVRQRLAQQQLNAGRMQDALTHLLANIEMLTAEVKTSPAKVGQPLLLNLNLGSSALQRMGKFEEVAPLWRAALTAASSTEATDASSKGLVSGLRRGLVGALITVGAPGDEARSITQTNLTEARADYEAQPDDAQVASRLAEAMTLEIGVAQREGGDKHLPLVATLLGFLDRQLEKHPDSNVLLAMFLSQRSSQVRDLSRTDPEAALKSLADYVARLNELKDKTEGKSPLITQALAQSKSLERMIESERKRLALIGQPAIPFEAEAWANGEALSSNDLQGKVVLLDFWAVWCGPCIATFPHLRDWNEKYGSRGFQVVGVTRYYQYGWDADAKRPSRSPDLSPEDERKALDQFAEHHQLKHPFAIMGEGSKFQDEYGVTGIPQAVLIDKKGIVRMIRVGSGDKNAHDLEELIEKLLAE